MPRPRARRDPWFSREQYLMADVEETLHRHMRKTKHPRKRKFPTPYDDD